MILPPTTAIATKRSVAMIAATALREVIFCFDVMYVILDFVKHKKMLKRSVFKMHYNLQKCTIVIRNEQDYGASTCKTISAKGPIEKLF